jgi:DnaJ-class molecular chaperone
LETQTKPGYYQLLNVSRSATALEIENAFQNLERNFHAAGKPKTMDDVEWLRSLHRAHDVLVDAQQRSQYDRMGDDFSASNTPSRGYDSAAIKQLSWSVDNEIRGSRIRWFMRTIFRIFGLSF